MKNFLSAICFLLLALCGRAQYNALQWKISGNGLKNPSYLFGTMHTSDARVFEEVKKAVFNLKETRAYAMELDPDKMMDMSLVQKVMMGKGYSLKQMIPAPEYQLLDSLAKKQLGFPLVLFDNVEPVFIMTLLETASMGLSDSSIDGNTEIMDLYFYKQARKGKKKIIGIETVEEQLEALNIQSYEEQARLLVEEIHALQQNNNDGPDVLKYYIEGQLDSLNNDTKDMPAVLYQALVTDRNKRMAERIGSFVKEQATFIAIGALHLPGDGGVITLLRQQGYKVEPVKN